MRQRHADPNRVTVRADLAGGFSRSGSPVGPEAIPLTDLLDVLSDVDLGFVNVLLDARLDVEAATGVLLTQARCQGLAPTALTGTLGADPLAMQVRTGVAAEPDRMIRFVTRSAGWPGLRADDADELACSVATGVAYLRWLVDAGLGVGGPARAGVPVRRDRRPIRDDREAVRGQAAVGPSSASMRGP